MNVVDYGYVGFWRLDEVLGRVRSTMIARDLESGLMMANVPQFVLGTWYGSVPTVVDGHLYMFWNYALPLDMTKNFPYGRAVRPDDPPR